MEKNILKRIFFDDNNHWETFKKKHGEKIRPVVVKVLEKFRDCGDMKKGFKLYVCEGCNDVHKVAYRCKGCFCTTCSNGESEEWSRLLTEDVLQVNHRHMIFTIDEGLRKIFLLHRHLMKPLMDEAAKLVTDFFKEKAKVTPGIISGLHTFGSWINFNQHVHMLVTMGGITRKGKWKDYDYIPFRMLRKQWQTVVLKLIRKHLTKQEKKQVQPLLQKAYSENGEGFYVYAPKQKGNVKEQLRYIGHYIRRPAIGVNRIEEYDGQHVTFKYIDKIDGKEKHETLTVEAFICRLIRHYGMYSRRSKHLSKKLLSKWQEDKRRWIVKVWKTLRRQTWRERVIAGGQKDPLICPHCENYYIYQGEVCLENGQLEIKVALTKEARNYLERVIAYQAPVQEPQKTKEEKGNQPSRSEENVYQLSLFEVS